VVFVCQLLQYLCNAIDEATLFKFGKWVEYGTVHPSGKKISLKCSGSHDPSKNFKPPLIFLEWMKLHSLNLASGSTTASATPGVHKFPSKGAWSGSRAKLFKFCKCVDYGECNRQGLKIPLKRLWCRCVNFNPFNISRWMRWGSGAVRAAMLHRIRSLFLNDA